MGGDDPHLPKGGNKKMKDEILHFVQNNGNVLPFQSSLPTSLELRRGKESYD